MNLWKFALLPAFFVFQAGVAQAPAENGYLIRGHIKGIDHGQAQLLKLDLKTNETVLVDTAAISQGAFTFRGTLPSPYVHSIRISNESEEKIHLFLENREIQVSAHLNHLGKAKVTGSREDSLFRRYDLDAIFEKGPGMEIMLNHPDYTFAAFTAYYQFQLNEIRADTLDLIMDHFSDEVKQSEYYQFLEKLYPAIKRVALTQPAPAFEIPDTNGQPVSLTDFKGQYVLLDFWASWCGPCRMEHPARIRVHQQYRSRGFQIIGISVDEKRDLWLQAIAQDRLPWIQVSNLKGWDEITDTYGVKAVPQNFLLDPEGMIIAKNLSPEALDHTLKGLLEGVKEKGPPNIENP